MGGCEVRGHHPPPTAPPPVNYNVRPNPGSIPNLTLCNGRVSQQEKKIVRENFPSDLLNLTLTLGLLENSKDPLKYVDNPLIKVFAKVVIIPWQWELGTGWEGGGRWWLVGCFSS